MKSQDDFVLGVSWVVQDIGAALDGKEKGSPLVTPLEGKSRLTLRA